MDAATEARMLRLAEEAGWQVTISLACGSITDEGDERRPPVFEFSRLAALEAARAGYLGDYAAADANSRSVSLQAKVSEFLADPAAAKAAGVIVIEDVPANRLGSAEFFARRAEGVAQLMRSGMFGTKRAAELEWMRREAEVETGFLRDDPHPSRRAKFRKAYRALQRRDWG